MNKADRYNNVVRSILKCEAKRLNFILGHIRHIDMLIETMDESSFIFLLLKMKLRTGEVFKRRLIYSVNLWHVILMLYY